MSCWLLWLSLTAAQQHYLNRPTRPSTSQQQQLSPTSLRSISHLFATDTDTVTATLRRCCCCCYTAASRPPSIQQHSTTLHFTVATGQQFIVVHPTVCIRVPRPSRRPASSTSCCFVARLLAPSVMWLKEVLVDGFKSYAVRQSIGPFDSAFTAITGLNGTGKSNILDAICFVLGITQLQQVRVSQLSELVYKNGQAGVSSATVTLVFDNSQPSSSPVGYSEYSQLTVSRQVVMGGKSTYKINGQLAQQSRVATLFQSVGLNVNNPHFLIMQGRITKVINMRPTELLSLIEEAAGTRLFEAKKQTALRTIARKQSKLDEINSLLDSQIQPTLQRLRDDQQLMAVYEAKQQQLSDLGRVHTAFQYHKTSETVQQLEGQWAAHRQTVDEREAAVERLNEAVELQQTRCEQLEREAQRDAEDEAEDGPGSGRPCIAELESELSEASKRLVQATSSWNNCKEAKQAEEEADQQRAKAIEQQRSEERAAAERRRQLAAALSTAQAQLHSLKQQLDEARAKELGVGVARTAPGKPAVQEGGGLHGVLMAAQQRLSTATTQATHARRQIDSLQADIRSRRKEQAAHKQQHESISRQCAEKEKEASRIRQQIKVSHSTILPTSAVQEASIPVLICHYAAHSAVVRCCACCVLLSVSVVRCVCSLITGCSAVRSDRRAGLSPTRAVSCECPSVPLRLHL